MCICQHVVAVKQGLVTACLGKLVVRANVDVNHLVKVDVNHLVKVAANQNLKLIGVLAIRAI